MTALLRTSQTIKCIIPVKFVITWRNRKQLTSVMMQETSNWELHQ